jgi:uncharacterized membrane protein YidH (DUF202 family)
LNTVGGEGGLQAERTSLAWTRTSFAVLGNGALLLVKQLPYYRSPGALILAGIAAVVALVVYVVGLQRQRTLARRPLPRHITPRREVHVMGGLVIALTLLTVGWLLI